MLADALLLSGACFVAAFCAGMAGFAFVLVGAGLLLQFLPPATTAPVLVLGSFVVQSIALKAMWDHVDWQVLRRWMLFAIPGMPLGVWLLAHVPAGPMTAGVGALLVVYAGYMLARIGLRLPAPSLQGGPAADGAVGFASGILGGIGGYVGALPAMWADAQGLDKLATRGLLQPFIVFMQLLTLPALMWAGFFTREAVWLSLAALPGMLAGMWLGLAAFRRLPQQGFRLVLLGLLLISGLSLLI
ncbi:sulfite exporter TauE/SafE family protein [Sabulicella glaciei]|uniref:Probable membrane transporter protein n=1 Tax=Sabulicella glaciei TaxID=2984948 RepID=A0ABT3NR15_9PROT|nr:sulfite exporter TauE/SafE family protein [Roseococcus sp. MDT2-1-1]MCW8084600.1 sulfite exporter TauE/SafE family protein [Roseococcus sp. MDT2-1-1]